MARVRLALVLAFLVSATVCHNITLTNDQLDTYIKTCLTKTRISQAFYKSDDENLKRLSERQKSCFLACMFKKSGIISDDGTVGSVTDDHEDSATNKAIKRCTKRAKGDICRLAWCLRKLEKFSIPIIVQKPRIVQY
ncbi:hypothetical protein TKK_0010664 [Trichogramma kaykai]|uniref:Uncharacterized protein n=1 Tax=Trichogramma kaykai TaxID=54128 RepID=A0ABD2WVR5_9HYME